MLWVIWTLRQWEVSYLKRKFFYDIPTFIPDENGNIILLQKKSVSPIEIFQYGISQNGKFYLLWDYPLLGDDELESDYREISKERIMNDLGIELNICDKEGNLEIVVKISEALEFIKKIKE